MRAEDLHKLLGRKYYRILMKIFQENPSQDLTLNDILGLFKKIIEVEHFGVTEAINLATGDRILVRLTTDAFAVFQDSMPDKPALKGNIEEAKRLLKQVGIKPIRRA